MSATAYDSIILPKKCYYTSIRLLSVHYRTNRRVTPSRAPFLAKSGYLFLDSWLLGAQDIQKCFKGWALRSTPGGTKTHGFGFHCQWPAYRFLPLQAARVTRY